MPKPWSLTISFRQADIMPRIKILFDTDDKVRFYTGLPSMEVLMIVFGHVSLHVTRQTQGRSTDFMSLLLCL